MRTPFILLLPIMLLFLCQTMRGQQVILTKQALLKVFRQSTGKNSPANTWMTDNKDSTFFTSDTVKLFNDNYYYYHSRACHFVNWNFKNAHVFMLSKSFMCTEPPIDVVPFNSWYRVKLKTINHQLYLRTYNRGRLIKNYKILGLSKVELGKNGNRCNVLTLVKQKHTTTN